MRIIADYPPNYELLKQHFDVGPGTSVIFCYGNAIYNPYDQAVREDLIVHEEVHAVQQGNDPDGWWDRYIKDPEFRIKQEVEAYSKQARFIRLKKGLRGYDIAVRAFAGFLASPTYGNIITEAEAMERMRNVS